MLQVRDFVSFIDGVIERGHPNFEFNGVSTDTRTLKKGNLFIPLRGENFDGHNFIKEALKAGAAGFITSRKDCIDLPGEVIISVSDTLKAYEDIARVYREKFSLPVIAVTGSNGKTTTKELIATLLGQKFKYILKSQENFNNEIGVSRTLLDLSPHHECVVLEFAMRGHGEIKELSHIAQPHIGVITNIGEAHIGRLGSRENIAKAKAELLESLPSEGLAVLNRDNDYFEFLLRKVSCKINSFGFSEEADIFPGNIQNAGFYGIELDIHFKGKTERIFFPMIGRHNIYNLLAAVSVASYLIEDLLLSDVLKSFIPPLSGRTKIIQNKNDITIIDDTYNSNPMAVKSILDTIYRYFPDRRKIAVLGDMLELGEEGISSHRKVGEWVSEARINYLMTCGPLSHYTVETASSMGIDAQSFADKVSLVKKLKDILQPGDVLLVKGSRGMQMEEVLECL